MRYFLDCEFDGIDGLTLSIALVGESGTGIYLVADDVLCHDPWVFDNVIPVLHNVPDGVETVLPLCEFGKYIREFLKDESIITLICDSPADITRFCDAYSRDTDSRYFPMQHIAIDTRVHNIESYPTEVPNAIRHNAWYDALALKYKIDGVPD